MPGKAAAIACTQTGPCHIMLSQTGRQLPLQSAVKGRSTEQTAGLAVLACLFVLFLLACCRTGQTMVPISNAVCKRE